MGDSTDAAYFLLERQARQLGIERIPLFVLKAAPDYSLMMESHVENIPDMAPIGCGYSYMEMH